MRSRPSAVNSFGCCAIVVYGGCIGSLAHHSLKFAPARQMEKLVSVPNPALVSLQKGLVPESLGRRMS